MPASRVVIAEPQGFCAGVDSAVKSLAWMVVLHRPPVFCVHAVVHNEDVVDRFERLGVRFVDHPDQAPPGAPVLLSAHGSTPEVVRSAEGRASIVVDAICPLVTKVHHEIRTRARDGGAVVYVGHAHHDEAVGALAQAPDRTVRVETPADVETVVVPEGAPVAVLAQTTLAFDAWQAVVAAARRRFGDVWLPPRADLCFATTNRQQAVRHLVGRCDRVIVVGSPSSSNSRALVETARRAGCADAALVPGPDALPAGDLGVVGLTAGASTPAAVVDRVVRALEPATVERVRAVREDAYFPLARPVRRRLGELDARGALPAPLRDAYVHDRTTSPDDLLAHIERGDLVGVLDAAPAGGPALLPAGGAAAGRGAW